MDGKDHIHAGQRHDLVHGGCQPDQNQFARTTQQFTRGNDGAQPAGIDESNLSKIKDEITVMPRNNIAKPILEGDGDTGVDPVSSDRENAQHAAAFETHVHGIFSTRMSGSQ